MPGEITLEKEVLKAISSLYWTAGEGVGDPGGVVRGSTGERWAGWGCANGVSPPSWVVLVSYTDCRLERGSFIDQQSQVCEQEMILKTLEVRTDQKQLTRDTRRAGGFGSLPATPLPKLSSFPANA